MGKLWQMNINRVNLDADNVSTMYYSKNNEKNHDRPCLLYYSTLITSKTSEPQPQAVISYAYI
jgi:hypothetical protein